ncbi:hypothetical protein [Acidomonas methanolica]|uniref:Uncharacterized protein n=1 Tax=Acidomonas methanolica NBRC 104435 TaxID=1231351 RepID=A0A023D5U9_ACIMT|nr:hypothetical protein [Acidomonas methanolica]MBU2652940.1 hypothetical protein [Acidomonas methanolica]TCS31343.1 hypothetical protein EDC31_103187 [Acidomonas methanolica]GAJ29522.1 hypothetical protein Amme_064_016 [Acidomonas methanolica NBRC 104435]GBQ56316.1 hypothetical protein AA0498_2375 [Acidomonas methanolica]GEK98409.1 hypothetical protein AME01nite_09080 [Acidomonas methanolica NBRC 104435]
MSVGEERGAPRPRLREDQLPRFTPFLWVAAGLVALSVGIALFWPLHVKVRM